MQKNYIRVQFRTCVWLKAGIEAAKLGMTIRFSTRNPKEVIPGFKETVYFETPVECVCFLSLLEMLLMGVIVSFVSKEMLI